MPVPDRLVPAQGLPGGRPVIPSGAGRRGTGPHGTGARGGGRRGAGQREVTLVDGFWHRLQRTNAEATLGHCLEWIERLGWLANFDAVADGTTGPDRPGWQFSDSEVYKLMEAMAWEHGRTADPVVGELIEQLTRRIGRAQDEDGYLNTCFGHAGQGERYSDMEMGHELYCTGHLLQAAVARLRTHGPDDLVEIARRAAEHVCRVFGPDGREAICGHPEIEVGLAEFGRATGEPRYVEQARLFVERRGRRLLGPVPLLGPSYFQDDVPVAEAEAWRGHAVRALYLTAAAVDVAVDLGDDGLLEAVERQWTRSVERRTYITGGMGSRHQDEGFGEDWELPPDRAYCETCAGVASVMVSWRLYLVTGDVRYPDLMERTFYNVVATSPREDGRAFFYANPLQQRVPGVDVRQDAENPRAEGGARAPWFDVSCCPTNLARTLATWETYAVSVEADRVTLLQYASYDLRVRMADGAALALRVRTGYPREGEVEIEVVEAPATPVTLRLRVPHWGAGATLARGDGAAVGVEPGWVDVDRVLVPGERLVLRLPVAPRLTWPDARIDAVRGCVAVERGPVVLCLESTDLPAGTSLETIRLDATVAPMDDDGGAVVRARVLGIPAVGGADGSGAPPYGPTPTGGTPGGSDAVTDLRLIPYHGWAERGPATMRVFIPVA